MNHSVQTGPPSSSTAPPPPSLNIGDIYYIFFRHKRKIALVFLAGLLGAVGYYFVNPPLYESEAKILIRYVLEARSGASGPGTSGPGDSQIKSPDARGDNIVNSEIEILTSTDLAGQVADAVGPEKVLARAGGAKGDGQDHVRAAAVISKGLYVEAPGRGSVLRVIFRHPEPAIVQPVLSALVDAYLKKHKEIHQDIGVMDDFFLRQTDQLRTRLSETEQELKKLKAEANIISLEDSKRASIEQIVRIQSELLAAEAELVERRASIDSVPAPISTNSPATNSIPEPSLPQDIIERYHLAAAEVESLQRRRTDLRSRYRDEHHLVRSVDAQLSEAEAEKRQLETEHPSLARLPRPMATAANPGIPNQVFDPAVEIRRVSALQAKVKELTRQLAEVRADANRVAEAEPAITQRLRAREVYEANYRFYLNQLDKLRTDETLGAGKITNISVVQTPSTPARDLQKVMKPMIFILVLGCFGGFGLGFVSDRFLNQTIKRVADVERHLPVPLFVSVPDMTWRNRLGFSKAKNAAKSLPAADPAPDGNGATGAAVQSALAPWDAGHKLRPYYEGLRDRLITYFEVRDMRHKPKMVAVTGCASGAGVTTMAAGLAAALSETGDGKVLLVDMNQERGAAHPFYQGKPGVALSDALENATREQAFVHDGLYLVSAGAQPKNQQLPSVLPKRFANLVPKMKASDYDYIIFDMPPVTQTTVTARLAGYMDMVLLVVESEKTGQEILKRTHGLLNESRPNMAAILNKHRPYLPAKFAQEL